MRLRIIVAATVLLLGSGAQANAAPNPIPTPTPSPTLPATCGPTATPYCATQCLPCPTIRAGCYADACGECHENPVCGTGEVCQPSGPGGCCLCVPIGGTATPTATALLAATATPRPCDGDCNGDGTIGIEELVTAVDQALNGTLSARCPYGFDRDGDGVVNIAELIWFVRAALEGCPASPFDGVEGVYDVLGLEMHGDGSIYSTDGLATVDRLGDGVTLDLEFNQLEELTLRAHPLADGSLKVHGYGFTGGDIVTSAHGTATFSRIDDRLRFAVEIDVDSFILDSPHLSLTIERPSSENSAHWNGSYRLHMHHARENTFDSHIDLALTVAPSGLGTFDATADIREDDGSVASQVGGGSCRLSPGGRLACSAPYSSDGVPLLLFGGLVPGGNSGSGTFWVAQFPLVRDNGTWDVAAPPG